MPNQGFTQRPGWSLFKIKGESCYLTFLPRYGISEIKKREPFFGSWRGHLYQTEPFTKKKKVFDNLVNNVMIKL